MAIKIKANGELKDLTNAHVKVNGAVKTILEALTLRDGKWVKSWTNNIIAVNVSHTTTSTYDMFEDKYDKVTNVIKIEDLVVKVYNGSGTVIETLTVAEETLGSIAYNIGNSMVDFSILADNQNNVISYSVSINTSTDARKVSFTIGKIYKV